MCRAAQRSAITSRLPERSRIEPFEKAPEGEDLDTTIRLDHRQVVVSRDHEIGLAGDGRRQHQIIVRVPVDAPLSPNVQMRPLRNV